MCELKKEIGGYIEYERYSGKLLHDKAIALNCGRNCLAYLIETKQIKKIWLPFYLCDSVKKICADKNVQTKFYNIDKSFQPIIDTIDDDEWIYIVNYYGQISNDKLNFFLQKHIRIIVDNAQAYFQSPLPCVDTIYTCRKFFGVADGAFLYTDSILPYDLPIDESFDRMKFLMGRFERNASEFYADYVTNNKLFTNENLKSMSKLTENLLRSFEYERIKKIRTSNFNYLYNAFSKINLLELNLIEGAFSYPLYLENGNVIRDKLAKEKIYIPILWPNVLNDVNENDVEYKYVKNILPIPCDQRYSEYEMKKIVEEIYKCIS